MKFNYNVEVDTDKNIINIKGTSSNNTLHYFGIEKDNSGYISFLDKSFLDGYNDKVFTGGEWQYFERQKESFKYILGDTHSSNHSYPNDPNNKRKPRNGYRPVTVKRCEYDSEEEIKGYLMGFGQQGSIDHQLYTLAIVELEDGKVEMYIANQIKFDDV